MALFYFDLFDGGVTIDDTGTEFFDTDAALAAAIRTLPDIARDEISSGQSREVSVLVRNNQGKAIFTAALTLTSRLLVETA